MSGSQFREYEDVHAKLLTDASGVYGLGLVGNQAEPDGDPLIIRPDRLIEQPPTSGNYAALQPIPRNNHAAGIFRCCAERNIADGLFTAMLAREGWERKCTRPTEWWANSKKQRDKNRRKYHGLKGNSIGIVNFLVRQALAEAPEKEIKSARRFPITTRHMIYRKVVINRRFRQLVETFPLVLLAITFRVTADDERLAAVELIEKGARLNVVADALGFPMWMRNVKPGATLSAIKLIKASRDGLPLPEGLSRIAPDYLPAGTAAQRRWLHAVRESSANVGGPYAEWVARHAIEIGTTLEQVRASVQDIGDWARACYAAGIPEYVIRAIQGRDPFGPDIPTGVQPTRLFSPDMATHTVRDLSADWHEAVALAKHDTTTPLPAPWRPAEKVNGWDILPLASAVDIAEEGRTMRHCVGTYISKVQSGEFYVYSARDDEQRVATISIQRNSGGVSIEQMRGPCNAILPKKTQAEIRRWVRQKSKWCLPEIAPPLWGSHCCNRQGQDLDDEIPF